jgi:hypothetical protein
MTEAGDSLKKCGAPYAVRRLLAPQLAEDERFGERLLADHRPTGFSRAVSLSAVVGPERQPQPP